MEIIPPCAVCVDRRAEALLIGEDSSKLGFASPYLCFNCLSDRPELRFFKALAQRRKMPPELGLRRTEVAQALRDQGMSYRAIGEKFGVGHVPVLRWLDPDAAQRDRQYRRGWEARNKKSQRERKRAFNEAHPLYISWYCIRHRCYTPSAENYADYGGRGIKMHPTWENNFAAFEAWIDTNLGPRPEGTTLDRKDNDADYAPGNVRWASRSVQQKNRRPLAKNAMLNELRAQLRDAGLEPCA